MRVCQLSFSSLQLEQSHPNDAYGSQTCVSSLSCSRAAADSSFSCTIIPLEGARLILPFLLLANGRFLTFRRSFLNHS
eukprot:3446212-Pleurochrysis_carterae.AAC.1